MLFIACHFIWVLFPGHFARWEGAVNAVISVRPLMMLQGFDKDTKPCLQKGGSFLITPEKQASLSLSLFNLCHWSCCVGNDPESQAQVKFSVFPYPTALPYSEHNIWGICPLSFLSIHRETQAVSMSSRNTYPPLLEISHTVLRTKSSHLLLFLLREYSSTVGSK